MLNEILIAAIQCKASDVHLQIGAPPILRVNRLVQCMETPPVSAEYMGRIVKRIMDERALKDLETNRDYNFSYEIENTARFRVNVHYQRGAIAMAFRVILSQIANLEHLHVPDVVSRLTKLPRGLILVTGPAGCGKSTTLAAMLDAINRREKGHIVTVEDPIEYTFNSERCLVEQREIGIEIGRASCRERV